ncbi:YafY family protein [Cryobacterium sp.]|uniref:helix-turn-helix transcriptional regulator n=1 Tax=Cryobacterium sp. TaxID=1926290 RepID=UPI002635016F|nr:WYL domain-containing protein [Cryobacterium sp.]MCU1445715.1 transcriptional regulator [Cryobacterium sp.]
MSPTPEHQHPVTVEERLFSLVLALIATQIGLTKSEILSTVQGYRQRFQIGGDNASLERQFERDKDDIRELGIPLETIESPDDPGSNHHLRYRIPKGLYDLPADITFSPDEIMLLKLAATVWREGSLSAESRRALTKLNSLGIDSTDPIVGYAPFLRARESSFEPLSKAMDRGQVVAFLYLKPGESAPRRRVVAPLAVVLHEGRWHLYGTDQDAAAPRTFLLSRIVGPVVARPGGGARRADDGQGERALAELDALWQAQTASIAVEAGSDAAVRLGKRGAPGVDADTVDLHYTDLNILADELAGYGPEVLVRSPAALREAVLTRLRQVRDSHTIPTEADR